MRAFQVLPAKALTFSLAPDAWSLPFSQGGDVPVEQNCSTTSSEAHIQTDSPVPEKNGKFQKELPSHQRTGEQNTCNLKLRRKSAHLHTQIVGNVK